MPLGGFSEALVEFIRNVLKCQCRRHCHLQPKGNHYGFYTAAGQSLGANFSFKFRAANVANVPQRGGLLVNQFSDGAQGVKRGFPLPYFTPHTPKKSSQLQTVPRNDIDVGPGLCLVAAIHQDGWTGLLAGEAAPLVEAAGCVFAGGRTRFDFDGRYLPALF